MYAPKEGGHQEERRLSVSSRLAVFARSFLLQSVWNPRGMQNVGFCFALMPIAPPRDEQLERAAFLERHLKFFNTNPVLASYVLGATAAAERAGRGAAEADDLKRALAGPLGMAGDGLFWGALRPFAALAGVLGVLAFPLYAAASMLVIYNVPHVALRWRGVVRGAELGGASARDALGPGLRELVALLRAAAAVIAGLIVGWAVAGAGGGAAWRSVVAGGYFTLGVTAARLGVPPTVIGVAGAIGGLVLMATGVAGG